MTYIIPFEPKSYQLQPPNFSAEEKSLGRFGRRLFHDRDFSKNKDVSCSTCHRSEFGFADNVQFSQGVGKTSVNTPSVLNQFFQEWFFWDGRVHSLEAQALQPLEHPDEHGIDRMIVAEVMYRKYRKSYEFALNETFPVSLVKYFEDKKNSQIPTNQQQKDVNRVFVNFAKAVAQFERGLIALDSPFDKFMAQYEPGGPLPIVDGFEKDEFDGFQVFIGKGRCVACHSGALLTDGSFHFTGLSEQRLSGRAKGLEEFKNN